MNPKDYAVMDFKLDGEAVTVDELIALALEIGDEDYRVAVIAEALAEVERERSSFRIGVQTFSNSLIELGRSSHTVELERNDAVRKLAWLNSALADVRSVLDGSNPHTDAERIRLAVERLDVVSGNAVHAAAEAAVNNSGGN